MTVTRMERVGIYGFSRGDILDGMTTSQNPLDFIPLNESADERSGGWVISCINSWWKDRTGVALGGRALKRLSPDDWFSYTHKKGQDFGNPPHQR